MELRRGGRAALLGAVLLMSAVGAEIAPVLKAGETPASALEAVSDTLDLLKQRMGWKAAEVKLGSIDTRDAKIGQTLIYEFDIQVGSTVIPLRLSEEVATWQYLQELPAPGGVHVDGENEVKKEGAVDVWRPEAFAATLAPFEVAGPVDLWIQDAEELRLAMPHDVDAGVLKRVLLADGAVVSVQGAREVSLSRPLQLPLPLTRGPEGGLAASLVALAARLRSASRGEEKPLLSLRIVGPTSLTAVKTSEEASSGGRLKVKRLGSGAIEVTSPVTKKADSKLYTVPYGTLALTDKIEDLYMWPLPAINMTKLAGLEEALIKTLGPEAYKQGSFQLLKAKVAAASFVQIDFEVEKAVEKELLEDEVWPEWATKPNVERLQFELLTKVEGRKLMPVRVQQSEPVLPTIAMSSDFMMDGNVTMKAPPILMPPGAMTLDVDLDGIVD